MLQFWAHLPAPSSTAAPGLKEQAAKLLEDRDHIVCILNRVPAEEKQSLLEDWLRARDQMWCALKLTWVRVRVGFSYSLVTVWLLCFQSFKAWTCSVKLGMATVRLEASCFKHHGIWNGTCDMVCDMHMAKCRPRIRVTLVPLRRDFSKTRLLGPVALASLCLGKSESWVMIPDDNDTCMTSHWTALHYWFLFAWFTNGYGDGFKLILDSDSDYRRMKCFAMMPLPLPTPSGTVTATQTDAT